MKRSICALLFVLLTASCTSTAAPAKSSPDAPPNAGAPTQSPATQAASIALENALAQQVSNDLSAHPRPECAAGTHNELDWANYVPQLAPALSKLFTDPRGQSLAPQALAGIFKQASSLSLDAVSSGSEAVLVTIVKANCNNRVGGGDSPAAPRDLVLVLDRHGGLWQIGQVANVLSAAWTADHWNALVTALDYGGGAGFEVWNIKQVGTAWKSDSKFQFTQAASLPLPRLSADGAALTVYSPAISCNVPKSVMDSNPTIQSDYKLQNGQYVCITSRAVPSPVPTRVP